jgi:rubrerythrin
MPVDDLRCIFRPTIICKFQHDIYADTADKNCELCLAGQQIDSIELLTSTMMERGMDMIEKETNKPHARQYKCSSCGYEYLTISLMSGAPCPKCAKGMFEYIGLPKKEA